MSILQYLNEELNPRQIVEMPHGEVNHIGIDFKLEKLGWDKRLIELISFVDNSDELLKPFYSMKYLQLFKKKFNELDTQAQEQLSAVLPDKFKQDVGI